MAHDVFWHDDDQSIIRVDIFRESTWAEIHATIDQVIPKVKSARRRIDIIFNSTVKLPPGNPIPNLKATGSRLAANPNMGLFVSVNPRRLSTFINMMVDIVARIYRLDRKHYGGFVHTVDEAVEIIMKDRAKNQAVL